MRRATRIVLVFTSLSLSLSLVACQPEAAPEAAPSTSAGEAQAVDGGTNTQKPAATASGEKSEHREVEVGAVTLAGKEYRLVLPDPLVPGREGGFEVHSAGGAGDESLYLWVEDAAGNPVSAPEKGHKEGKGLHFHVTPRTGAQLPTHVVLRVRSDGVDERAGLPLEPSWIVASASRGDHDHEGHDHDEGHGHDHDHDHDHDHKGHNHAEGQDHDHK